MRVRYRDREWVFPRGDCVLLPIENTTAELLARYIAGRLLESLKTNERFVPEVLARGGGGRAGPERHRRDQIVSGAGTAVRAASNPR